MCSQTPETADAENVHFILVERVTTRFKVDGKHRKKDSVFERLQIDIQHLCLNRVPVLREGRLPVVGIGKHLCGVATGKAAGHTVTSALAQGAGACMAPPPRAVCALIELT